MSLVAQNYAQPTLFLSVLFRGPSSPSYFLIAYLFICFPPTAACAQRSFPPRLSSRVTLSCHTENACLFVKTLYCTPVSVYAIYTCYDSYERSGATRLYNKLVALISLSCGRLSSGDTPLRWALDSAPSVGHKSSSAGSPASPKTWW